MTKGLSKRVARAVICLGLGWSGSGGTWAAEPAQPEEGEARASFQDRRERLRHQMDVELEGMARVCALDAKQRQRLEVAARGVVERLLEDRQKAPDPDDPVEWRWEDEGLAAARPYLLEHPLWKATLREVLTSAQVAAMEGAERAMERFQRDAAIRLASGLLQMEMRLTEEQRVRMAELLEKSLPEGFNEPDLETGSYTHWLDPEEVRAILTGKQMVYWLDLRRSHAGEVDDLLNR